jgi:hypothetical protein
MSGWSGEVFLSSKVERGWDGRGGYLLLLLLLLK